MYTQYLLMFFWHFGVYLVKFACLTSPIMDGVVFWISSFFVWLWIVFRDGFWLQIQSIVATFLWILPFPIILVDVFWLQLQSTVAMFLWILHFPIILVDVCSNCCHESWPCLTRSGSHCEPLGSSNFHPSWSNF